MHVCRASAASAHQGMKSANRNRALQVWVGVGGREASHRSCA
jgi:hypothetical protein